MNANLPVANQAVYNAIQMLKAGDKHAARRWAQKAAQLAPELEEPWLVLASIAEPDASKAYVQLAFKINPASQGVLWVQEQITAKNKPDNKPDGIKSTSHALQMDIQKLADALPPPGLMTSLVVRVGTILFIAVTGAIVLLTFLMFTGIILFGNVSSVKAAEVSSKREPETTASGQAEVSRNAATPIPTRLAGAAAARTLPSAAVVIMAQTSTPLQVATPTPNLILATAVPTGDKRIEVVISEQKMYAYQGDRLIYKFVTSTGANNNTPIGSFEILDKIPNPYSYSLGFYMPDWMGFTWIGNLEDGIHALPVLTDGEEIWGNGLGIADTTGCVVLSAQDAQQLYNWADEGTPLIIRQ